MRSKYSKSFCKALSPDSTPKKDQKNRKLVNIFNNKAIYTQYIAHSIPKVFQNYLGINVNKQSSRPNILLQSNFNTLVELIMMKCLHTQISSTIFYLFIYFLNFFPPS